MRSSRLVLSYLGICLAIATVLPALAFVAGYVWLWLTGKGPRFVKRFYAKTLRLLKRGDHHPWNYTAIPNTPFVVGTMPRSEAHLDDLPADVTCVVTLNERWEIEERSPVLRGAPAVFADRSIEWMHLPTPDYTPPRPRDVDRFVSRIRRLQPSKRIFVHCNAGRGRSATLTICGIMALGPPDMTPEEAYDVLASRRRISAMAGCGGRVRTGHWRALTAYASRLKTKRATSHQRTRQSV